MNQESNYGVLKCRILETAPARGSHFQIHAIAEDVHYRISINIRSQVEPSEVLFYLDEDFHHELAEKITILPLGFNPIGPNIKRDYGLDYLRGNLFDLSKLQPLPDQWPGPDNDLNEKIRAIALESIKEKESAVYAFGRRWGPEGNKDEYFHFAPGDGIHDIHMNQGNSGFFQKENGIWEDGGLLIHSPSKNRWCAMFFAFQSQSMKV